MIHQPPNQTLITAHLTAGLEWSPALAARLNAAIQQAQRTIDTDAVMFTMKYTRQQTGVLRDSALLHTIIGSGEIRQETPYAKEVYYGGGAVNLSVNPFSSRRWYEKVKANHTEQILSHAQEVLNRTFSGG